MPYKVIALGRPRFADVSLEGQSEPARVWPRLLGGEAPGAAVASVRGPFAVASSASGETVLAVDRFARETVCYALESAAPRVAFRAVDLVGEAPELDPQAIFNYLFFHAIPSPRTIFRNVHRVRPGTLVFCRGTQVREQQYWSAAFDPPQLAPDFAATRDRFLQLLEDAVREQLDGGRPGCFLSGGTDSSTVAGMIAKVAGRVATFSIGFEAEGYDEMAFARIAARHFGAEHHEYYVTPDDLVRSIPHVAASFDQPFGNSSVVPAYFCVKMAKEAGVTRLLAGDGGDELFGGNSRYAKQRVFDAYSLVPAALRSGLLEPLFASQSGARIAPLRKAASYIEQARQPMPERTHLYNLLLRLGINEVLEPDFASSIDRAEPGRMQREEWERAIADSDLNRTLAYDWRFTLAESDLPKVRSAAALAGIEVGYPMLDERLLEFSEQLPPAWKLKGLKLRWFFKEALRGFLPHEVLTKKKQGFGLPFGVWAIRHGGLRALAKESLSGFAGRGIVRPAFLRDLIENKLHQHPGYYGEMIWILMMLEQWIRVHAPEFRHGASSE